MTLLAERREQHLHPTRICHECEPCQRAHPLACRLMESPPTVLLTHPIGRGRRTFASNLESWLRRQDQTPARDTRSSNSARAHAPGDAPSSIVFSASAWWTAESC